MQDLSLVRTRLETPRLFAPVATATVIAVATGVEHQNEGRGATTTTVAHTPSAHPPAAHLQQPSRPLYFEKADAQQTKNRRDEKSKSKMPRVAKMAEMEAARVLATGSDLEAEARAELESERQHLMEYFSEASVKLEKMRADKAVYMRRIEELTTQSQVRYGCYAVGAVGAIFLLCSGRLTSRDGSGTDDLKLRVTLLWACLSRRFGRGMQVTLRKESETSRTKLQPRRPSLRLSRSLTRQKRKLRRGSRLSMK